MAKTPAQPSDPTTRQVLDRARGRLQDYTADRRMLLLSVMAVIVGLAGAVIAWLLVRLIGLITNLSFYGTFSFAFTYPSHEHLGLLGFIPPIVGGLLVGFMARFGSEKIRGHGIPEAIEAILIGRSEIEPNVAVLKPLSSAIAIGTGGPFGAEGPIIMTGGAFGSIFAQFFQLSAMERKTLLVAGASAGMAAIFATPVAASLLAVELLLFEWKPRSFVPVAVAAATGAIARVPLLGMGPLFPFSSPALGLEGLLLCVPVGIAAGFVAAILTWLTYAFEDIFRKLPIHWMWWPAIGGIFIGITSLFEPQALGVGYDQITVLLGGNPIFTAVLLLLIVKSLLWALTLGSGTSGGVLAPLLIMGGAVGALEAHLMPVGGPAIWAFVSMAAVMGGTMRTPFTAVVFMLELTHDVNGLLPLLISASAAVGVTVLILPRSILTEKVARRGQHVIREYAIDPLEGLFTRDVMQNPVSLPGSMPLAEAAALVAEGAPRNTCFLDPAAEARTAAVVDDAGMLLGVVTHHDLLALSHDDGEQSGHLADIASRAPVVGYPDEPISRLADRMAASQVGLAPVISDESGMLVGLVGVRDVMRARGLQLTQELERTRPLAWHLHRSGHTGRASRQRQARAGGHSKNTPGD
ncbi:MAG TPA: chloride channel protein [Trueperaceae bacterium]